MTKQEDISRIWPSILHIETSRLGKLPTSRDSQFYIQTSPIIENSLAELKSEALSHPSSKFWTQGQVLLQASRCLKVGLCGMSFGASRMPTLGLSGNSSVSPPGSRHLVYPQHSFSPSAGWEVVKDLHLNCPLPCHGHSDLADLSCPSLQSRDPLRTWWCR